MNTAFVDTAGAVQQTVTGKNDAWVPPSPVPPSRLADQAARADIAELAYLLWEEKGCPTGSAESDWLESERRIQERVNFGPLQL